MSGVDTSSILSSMWDTDRPSSPVHNFTQGLVELAQIKGFYIIGQSPCAY